MNSVHPYCTLAIATMQTMPRASWPHRLKVSPPTSGLFDASIISDPNYYHPCIYRWAKRKGLQCRESKPQSTLCHRLENTREVGFAAIASFRARRRHDRFTPMKKRVAKRKRRGKKRMEKAGQVRPLLRLSTLIFGTPRPLSGHGSG